MPWPEWNQLESALGSWPHRSLVNLTRRAAARIAPRISEAADVYGPEAIEWQNAIQACLEALAEWQAGRTVSRFTLDLCAELARGTANSAANVVRLLGPSGAAERAELAFAAVAFALDTARVGPSPRAASFAFRSLRAAHATDSIPSSIWDADWDQAIRNENHSPLWPEGPPDWFREGLARWHAAQANLPKWLQLD
jgi:hypothetical protein